MHADHHHPSRHPASGRAAFTLLEVLIVLSIMVILSAMAVPRFVHAMKTAAVDQSAETIANLAEEARMLAINQPLGQAGMLHGVLVQAADGSTPAYAVRIRYNPDPSALGSAEAKAGWMACSTGTGCFEEGPRFLLPRENGFIGLVGRLRWFYVQRTGYPRIYSNPADQDAAPVGAAIIQPNAPITVTVGQLQAAGRDGTGGKRRTVTVIPALGITHTDG